MLQPGRNLTAGLLVVTFVVICICLHLMAELAHLDGARLKLEKAVNKLQESNLPLSSRHLSSSEEMNVEFGDDDTVIIYNRVPKTGSTTLAGILYGLCNTNKYYVIHLGMIHSAKTIALSDQMRFLHNITGWTEKKPALYHGHVAFIDYTKLGVKRKPIYINMIRDPVDRLVSFYYFTRNGDDIRPTNKQKYRQRVQETFDECVERGGEDCDPTNLWLQIPYFCGHIAECWVPGSEWALNKAKQNVLRYYLLVGITEEMEDFIMVLEAVLPRFFSGASELYRKGHNHLRKTSQKILPKPETVAKIHESVIWKMENEFYEFVRNHFHYIKEQLFDINENGHYIEKGHRFMYEKIRPG